MCGDRSFQQLLINGEVDAIFKRITQDCKVKHQDTATVCKNGAVYNLLRAFGFGFIGQTGRCLNMAMNDHKINVNMETSNS